jgi:hypothetical protein
MSNITITNNDIGNVILKDGKFDDGLLTFAGAGTVIEGTILAIDSVSLKFIPFVKGGTTNEDGIPKAVLTYDVTATGAGDETIRAMVGGEVRQDKLVIDADGDNSNVDAAVLSQLRDYSIIPIKNVQLNILDNQ